MVGLVSLLEATQNRDRALDAWLTDVNGLKTTLESGVLLDVLPVLVESRRADHTKLSPSEHRLQHVARIHRAFGFARPDERVHLVDEHDELALALGHFL